MDEAGRIFFLVTDGLILNYSEAAGIAIRKPVNARFAFNLDGGSSTGLCLGKGKEKICVLSVPVGSLIQVRR